MNKTEMWQNLESKLGEPEASAEERLIAAILTHASDLPHEERQVLIATQARNALQLHASMRNFGSREDYAWLTSIGAASIDVLQASPFDVGVSLTILSSDTAAEALGKLSGYYPPDRTPVLHAMLDEVFQNQ